MRPHLHRLRTRCVSGCMAFATWASCAAASPALPDIAFEQHLGAQIPLAAAFVDEQGRPTTLADVQDGRASVIVMGYYECPNLCSAVRQSLLASLAKVGLVAGDDYRVIAVSIDPAETRGDSAAARASLAGTIDERGGAVGAMRGWHFLTGAPGSTKQLADAIGFRYALDQATGQFAHPSGIVVVSPRGRVSRYFFGVDYPPATLRESLVAANGERVGSPVAALLLRCFHYDPATGRYSATVMDATRLLALASILALMVGVASARRRRLARKRSA